MILLPIIGYIGDFKKSDGPIYFIYPTFSDSGANMDRTGYGDARIYREDNVTQRTSGITETQPYDSIVGMVHLEIDISDNNFYFPGYDYHLVLTGVVLSGRTVNVPVMSFSIQNRVFSIPRHYYLLQDLFPAKGLIEDE